MAGSSREGRDRFLGLLTDQQRTTLRKELWRLEHPAADSYDESAGDDRAVDPLDSTLGWLFLAAREAELQFAGADAILSSIAPYLIDPAVLKKLSLGAEQEKRRQAVVAKLMATIKTCRAEQKKLPPDKRDCWLMEEKMHKAKADVEKSFLSLLAPRQFEIVQDAAMRSQTAVLLCSPWLLQTFAATEQQRAERTRIKMELLEQVYRVAQEGQEKKLQVLTPAQRHRLREVIDREDWCQ